MLLGLAAASTGAAGPALATVAGPSESATLLALGDATPRLQKACRGALAERDAIAKAWAPHWPRAPKQITVWNKATLYDYERDLTGRILSREHRVKTLEAFKESVDWWQELYDGPLSPRVSPKGAIQRRTHQLKRLREEQAQLVLAEMYFGECERIRKAAGYDAALARHADAQHALLEHTVTIMQERPETMAGAFAQAEALQACADEVPMLWQGVRQHQDETNWGSSLGASILRLARAAA